MSDKKRPKTVRSYISALKTVLRKDGLGVSEDTYILNSLVHACKYQNDTVNQIAYQKAIVEQIAQTNRQQVFNCRHPTAMGC